MTELTNPAAAKFVGGWWMPETEEHYIEVMKPGAKRHQVVDGRWAYQYHKLEAALTHIPATRRRVAVDVGGNLGLWSFHLAKQFDHVHAFEPMPAYAELFAANVSPTNVTLHKCALGAAAGGVRLDCPPDQTGNTHIVGAGDIPLRTLDSFGLDDVDLIKIDVEGYELPVVKGAEETLLRCQPWLVVEQKGNDRKFYGAPRDAAADWLKGLGLRDLAVIAGDHIMGWA